MIRARCAQACRILLVVAVVAACWGGGNRVAAQPGAQPPARFYGELTVDGRPARMGTVVTALVGDTICGARTTTEEGRYHVDVVAARDRAGCGAAGATVRFRVGETAAAATGAWAAGQFISIDLVAGVAAAPAIPSIARLNLQSPCIPLDEQPVCDDVRRRLWDADREAWVDAYLTAGQPSPDDDAVFDSALGMRVAAGDPAATAAVARLARWAHLRITAVRFRGTAPVQADEWIEVSNLGGAGQVMDGWMIQADRSGAEFAFPPDFILAAGASCRVYSGEVGSAACPGGGFNRFNLWHDQRDTAVLRYTPLDLTADRVRYSAVPEDQPPPPNLQLESPAITGR